MREPIFEDWGLIDYEQALSQQLERVETVSQDENHPGFLIFCTHPPTVTLGRQTQPEDVFAWKGKLVEVSRGGRATYHGPSQLVVYPILNLKNPRAGRGAQEIRGYLRAFENAIVEVLKIYGLQTTGRSGEGTDETGVWLGMQKIASLGIAVRKWVCFHGAAINIEQDINAFAGLKPCGFEASTMISLEQSIGKKIDRKEFSTQLKAALLNKI